MALHFLYQRCTTYSKARATKKSETKVEGHNGGLDAVPQMGFRGKAPVRGSGAKPPPLPEADNILLIRPEFLRLYLSCA